MSESDIEVQEIVKQVYGKRTRKKPINRRNKAELLKDLSKFTRIGNWLKALSEEELRQLLINAEQLAMVPQKVKRSKHKIKKTKS